MTMIALKGIPKGEQIFNDYGQLPRSDLLRRYGYITDRYKKWDVTEIDIESVVEAANEYKNLDEKDKESRVLPFFRPSTRVEDLLTRASLNLPLSWTYCRMAMILPARWKTNPSNLTELWFSQ